MLEILNTILVFLGQLLLAGWDLLTALAALCSGVLYHLHADAPRLEGLLVGVVLAWVMLRRERHPLLRVLSAPLKLIVDILDLAWDSVVEVVGDLWSTALGWIQGALGWCWGRVTRAYELSMSALRSLRDKLLRREKQE